MDGWMDSYQHLQATPLVSEALAETQRPRDAESFAREVADV